MAISHSDLMTWRVLNARTLKYAQREKLDKVLQHSKTFCGNLTPNLLPNPVQISSTARVILIELGRRRSLAVAALRPPLRRSAVWGSSSLREIDRENRRRERERERDGFSFFLCYKFLTYWRSRKLSIELELASF